MEELIMGLFEVVYAKKIEAEDFFDAVEKSKSEDVEILSVSNISSDDEDVYD